MPSPTQANRAAETHVASDVVGHVSGDEIHPGALT
jgi:hypothetical protein